MDKSLQKQIQEITDTLEQGVQDVFTSENYAKYLAAMSKFHNYSLNNIILISMQRPNASLIAGYQAWKKLHGRQVMKGEKGIKILAPAPYKVKKMVDKKDPVTQKAVTGSDGKRIKEEKEVVIPAYKVVTVFDVSQTEGRELPKLVHELTGEVEGFDLFFKALDKSCPVPIRFDEIEGGARGYFSRAKNEIVIKQGMSQMQTIKTAVHERAHQMLHSDQSQSFRPRAGKEIEAESVAYTVCRHYGIDTSDYSFAYVADWSDGKDTAELKSSLDLIRKTASQMISVIDKTLAEISRNKEKSINERPSILENLHRKQEQAGKAEPDCDRDSREENSRRRER